MAKNHNDWQQGGGQQVASGPGTEHGQDDELVGNTMQAGGAQAVLAGTYHRPRHQEARGPQQELADARLPRRAQLPYQPQAHQAQRHHGQGQLVCRGALFGTSHRPLTGGVEAPAGVVITLLPE